MANTPFEIIAAPFEVYISTGTDAFPAVTSTPAGTWVLFGTNGKRNQAEGGVTIEHSQTLIPVRTEGHTGPVKMLRTEENQIVRLTLLDLSKEVYKHALSGDAPTAQGTTGHDIGLSRAETVREVRLVVRGPSPAADNRNAQYEIPRAVQSGSPAVTFAKGAPSGIQFEFMTLDNMTAALTGERFGRLVIASA